MIVAIKRKGGLLLPRWERIEVRVNKNARMSHHDSCSPHPSPSTCPSPALGRRHLKQKYMGKYSIKTYYDTASKGRLRGAQKSPPLTPPLQEGLKKKASPARGRFGGGRKAFPVPARAGSATRGLKNHPDRESFVYSFCWELL